MVGMRSFRVGEVDMFESHSPMLWDHGQCISPEYECEQGEWKQPIPRELKGHIVSFHSHYGLPAGHSHEAL